MFLDFLNFSFQFCQFGGVVYYLCFYEFQFGGEGEMERWREGERERGRESSSENRDIYNFMIATRSLPTVTTLLNN